MTTVQQLRRLINIDETNNLTTSASAAGLAHDERGSVALSLRLDDQRASKATNSWLHVVVSQDNAMRLAQAIAIYAKAHNWAWPAGEQVEVPWDPKAKN